MALPVARPIGTSKGYSLDTPRQQSGLPGNRAKKHKVSKTWEMLKQRMARHSGAIAAHNLNDRPLLLAAAEDLPPSEWEQKLERWPEVAKNRERLRPRLNDVPQSARPVYTPSLSRASGEAEFLSSPSPSAMELGDHSGLLSLNTPPYARSPVPPEISPSEVTLSADHATVGSHPSLFFQCDSVFDEHDFSRDSLDAAKKRRDRRRYKPPPNARVCEEVKDKLQYLRDCKDAMGWQRYGIERRRLEFQSDLKKTQKYSPRLPGGRQVNQQTASAMAMTLTTRQCASPIYRNDPQKFFDNHLLTDVVDASRESSPTLSPRHARRNYQERRTSTTMDFLPIDTPVAEQQKTQAIAAFEYDHLCRQRKVATPILRTFAVELRTEPAPLSVDNWSLGDAPLIALAASPLRSSLAGVNECRLAGNRLTNAGLSAVVESLGAGHATVVDVSENAFNFRGIEKLTGFINRGMPRLREIDVSRNRLDEHSAAALIHAIADSCSVLEQARFSDIQMGLGSESGEALRELIRESSTLLLLDVSFNMLQGEGAFALVDGIYANGANKRTLRNVNLSWNCMGQGPWHEKVSERLSDTLRDNGILFHLDISFNGFTVSDCRALAKGVADNHTLWGLHLDGNAAVVDADGFICILEDMRPEMMEDATNFVKLKPASEKKQKQKGKKGGRPTSLLGNLDLGQISPEARVRSLLPKHLVSREFEIWHREYDMQAAARNARTAMECRQGMELPDKLIENPGLTTLEGSDQFTRALPPRMQSQWLETLSQNVRVELQVPYSKLWDPLLGRPGRGMQHCTGASCWVCQGWVEVNFVLTLGRSFPEELAGAKLACAFTSVDNFARPTHLQPLGDGGFEGARFLPPTQEPLLVVFQVDDNLLVASDMPRKRLKYSLRLALCNARKCDQNDPEPRQDRACIAEIQEANLLLLEEMAETRLKRVASSSEAHAISQSAPSDLLESKTRPRAALPISKPCEIAPVLAFAQAES